MLLFCLDQSVQSVNVNLSISSPRCLEIMRPSKSPRSKSEYFPSYFKPVAARRYLTLPHGATPLYIFSPPPLGM